MAPSSPYMVTCAAAAPNNNDGCGTNQFKYYTGRCMNCTENYPAAEALTCNDYEVTSCRNGFFVDSSLVSCKDGGCTVRGVGGCAARM